MKDSTLAIILSLIATVGTIIAPILLLIVKGRLAKIDRHINDVHKEIDGKVNDIDTHLKDVHKEIDGKVTMLLAANKLVDTAQGHKEGKEEERQKNFMMETSIQKQQVDKNTEAIKNIQNAGNKPSEVIVINPEDNPVHTQSAKENDDPSKVVVVNPEDKPLPVIPIEPIKRDDKKDN